MPLLQNPATHSAPLFHPAAQTQTADPQPIPLLRPAAFPRCFAPHLCSLSDLAALTCCLDPLLSLSLRQHPVPTAHARCVIPQFRLAALFRCPGSGPLLSLSLHPPPVPTAHARCVIPQFRLAALFRCPGSGPLLSLSLHPPPVPASSPRLAVSFRSFARFFISQSRRPSSPPRPIFPYRASPAAHFRYPKLHPDSHLCPQPRLTSALDPGVGSWS